MHFDKIIMNPPYDRSLHLKILRQVMNKADEVVNLSPIRWLQDPLAEMKGNRDDYGRFADIRSKITSLEVVKKDQVFKMFNIINSEDLGIYYLTPEGGWSGISSKKLIKKCFDRISNNLCNIEHNKKDGWRVRISLINNSNHRKGGLNNLGKLIVFYNGMKNDKPWYDYYGKNKWSKTTPEITDSIKFNSEEEANNFINVIQNTKFGQWYEDGIITDMNISNNNILWLPTYTHPWTDEMLYEYFGLTDSEIQEIEQVV